MFLKLALPIQIWKVRQLKQGLLQRLFVYWQGCQLNVKDRRGVLFVIAIDGLTDLFKSCVFLNFGVYFVELWLFYWHVDLIALVRLQPGNAHHSLRV